MPGTGNCFSNLPDASLGEVFEVLHRQTGITIERIVSNGQATPEGEWYDQESDEWVLVLQGSGELLFDNGSRHRLSKGEYIFIPKHRKHRVSYTGPTTIWLAIHMYS